MTAPLRPLLAVALIAGSMALGVPGEVAGAAPIDVTDNTPWTLPTRPPECTRPQIDSGNVAGCLLASHNDLAATGWGAPPAPGVGDGWNWNGYTYSGSPALVSWEATYITENAAAIGTVPAGRLESHVGAAPLFEGFLAEIMANGYKVNPWVTAYTFRSRDTGRFPNVREEMAHALFTLGIDALFTDNPDRFPRHP